MARDRLGNEEITLVYCTLCGAVIPYSSRIGERTFRFGTSGLLYRSNKLMFDEETHTLWSSLTGKPVVGRLVNTGIGLIHYPVVTTTWGKWKKLHPETSVLSLDTGFTRNYSEGAAYRDYFSSDRLMFAVSQKDNRLKNKTEVLTFRLAKRSCLQEELIPIAISKNFLRKHLLFQTEIDSHHVVVLTLPKGGSRVYYTNGVRFSKILGSALLKDSRNRLWIVNEEALVLKTNPGERLSRISSHPAFWFGWFAQFPDTILITRSDSGDGCFFQI
jgi:hypothetical protein